MAYLDFVGTKARKEYWTSFDGISLITDWRRRGVPIEEIAQKIGIVPNTLYKWRRDSAVLDAALNTTDDLVDGQVEGALLKRALGYTVDEETWELVDGVMTCTKIVKKHVPADVKAQMFWLANRRAGGWRQQQAPLPADDSNIIDVKNVLVQIEEVAGNAETSDDKRA